MAKKKGNQQRLQPKKKKKKGLHIGVNSDNVSGALKVAASTRKRK